jgi:tetratricopeptide (TPR) repeat protein
MLARMILFRDDPDDPARQAAALKAAYGAVNADPEAAEGWIAVGLALNSADKPQEALSYLLHARDFDSRNPLMLAVMAETYNNLDRVDRASNLIDEAIDNAKAANPVDAVTLAYAYWVKGDILSRNTGAEALAAWEEARRIAQTEPTMPIGYIAQSLWVYYFNTADTSKIVGILNDAAKRDKDDPINPYLLGRVYLKAGDQPKARTNFEHCRDLNPDQIKCLRWLGTVMYRDNNYQRAAELAQRAVDLGSKDPGAYLIAGLSYALTNRCAEAVPLLQAGLQLNPDANLLQQFQDGLRTCGTSGAAVSPPTATVAPGGN